MLQVFLQSYTTCVFNNTGLVCVLCLRWKKGICRSSLKQPFLCYYIVCFSGGVHHAVEAAARVGAQSFGLFLRPQRTWRAPPLKPGVADQFKALCAEHNFPPHLILPHGSYLVNLASPNPELREKSIVTLVEEMVRCQQLGLTLFNIHPGSTCGKLSRQEGIRLVAEGINRVHRETKGSTVKVVLENMCRQGDTLGGDLEELKLIIDQVEEKERVGVCLDTCHAMAAGYDLSTLEGFERLCCEFETKVGWQWLVGVHINDSLGPAGSHRLHQDQSWTG